MKKSFVDFVLRVRLPIIIIVAAVTYMAVFLFFTPERFQVGYKPIQPIPFSHKLHAGQMKIDCQYCHTGVSETRHATIPSVETCMGCHKFAKKDSPNIKKLTEYYEKGEALPWKRIHRLPEHAYFNHGVHVQHGIACIQCHGAIAGMDVVEKAKPLGMGMCLDCHRTGNKESIKIMNKKGTEELLFGTTKRAPDNCSTCHR